MQISKFDSTRFYREFTTRESWWEGASGIWDIEFIRNSGSVELLASYYEAKYGLKVTIRPMTDAETEIADVAQYLEGARARGAGQEEHREALFVKYAGSRCYENGHAIPIIYIKAGGKEALFLANSIGTRINDHKWIFKRHAFIKIYAIEGIREVSNTGCYIDAFALLNDAIGKEFGSYRTPDLLNHLETHSAAVEGLGYHKVTALHPRLLKTFQSSTLVEQYSDSSTQDITINKKGETIAQHFVRYKKIANTSTYRPSYVAQKGMRLRGVVEMEFYLQQFGDITLDQRAKFIEGAKRILKVTQTEAPSLEPISHLYYYACGFAQGSYCSIRQLGEIIPEQRAQFIEGAKRILNVTQTEAASVEPISRLHDYAYGFAHGSDRSGIKSRVTQQQLETQYRKPATTIAICVLSAALTGSIVGQLLKSSFNMQMFKALATTIHLSETTSALIKDAAIGGFVGLLGSAIHIAKSV